MKLYLCYVVWNKESHIPWLCEGIRHSIPRGTTIDFIFDNCTDNSCQNLQNCIADKYGYGSLKGYDVQFHISTKKYRWPNTNDAIERFMQSKAEIFLSPQDDQKLQDKHLIPNLQALINREGYSNIGMIGMRDGINRDGTYHSSNFSKETRKTVWLRSGEYKEAFYVNDGPICLTKNTIQKVGLFDLSLWVHYGDNDYSFRCGEQGLKNFVMGAEVIHEKWGVIQASEVWGDAFSKHDYDIYKAKWPQNL